MFSLTFTNKPTPSIIPTELQEGLRQTLSHKTHVLVSSFIIEQVGLVKPCFLDSWLESRIANVCSVFQGGNLNSDSSTDANDGEDPDTDCDSDDGWPKKEHVKRYCSFSSAWKTTECSIDIGGGNIKMLSWSILRDNDGDSPAYCTWCKVEFSLCHGWANDVCRHFSTAKHISSVTEKTHLGHSVVTVLVPAAQHKQPGNEWKKNNLNSNMLMHYLCSLQQSIIFRFV